MIPRQLDWLDQASAQDRLAGMVAANCRAPATVSYREHRAAALKATRGP